MNELAYMNQDYGQNRERLGQVDSKRSRDHYVDEAMIDIYGQEMGISIPIVRRSPLVENI
jgi:hypothetical protein